MKTLTKLTPKNMADEILSIYKEKKILPNQSLNAWTLLFSFKASKDKLQQGMDWLINKGLLREDEFKKGMFILTASGYVKTL
jgi:hypothetical protein